MLNQGFAMSASPLLRIWLLACCAVLPAPTIAAEIASAMVEDKLVELSFPAQARVEALREATIAAQVSGRVIDLRVDAGDTVKRGQLLLTLDARELAAGDAASQAQLTQAKAAWERAQNLFRQKFISQSALDQAEAAFKAAQGGAGASSATLSHTRVTAPISGVVAERLIEPGEMAAPGRPLLTLFDPAGLRVIATVPQARLNDVRKARRARIELVESGRSINVDRIEVLPTIDQQSHTATVRLSLPAGTSDLLPGMAVRAHLSIGAAQKLVLPQAAVLRRGEVTAVYVLDAQGKARLRQIRLGETVGDGLVEVLAGVNAGERVSLDPVKTGVANKARE